MKIIYTKYKTARKKISCFQWLSEWDKSVRWNSKWWLCHHNLHYHFRLSAIFLFFANGSIVILWNEYKQQRAAAVGRKVVMGSRQPSEWVRKRHAADINAPIIQIKINNPYKCYHFEFSIIYCWEKYGIFCSTVNNRFDYDYHLYCLFSHDFFILLCYGMNVFIHTHTYLSSTNMYVYCNNNNNTNIDRRFKHYTYKCVCVCAK